MRRILAISAVLTASLAAACVHGPQPTMPQANAPVIDAVDALLLADESPTVGLNGPFLPQNPSPLLDPFDISGPRITPNQAINEAVLGHGQSAGPGRIDVVPGIWVAPRQ